MLTLRGVGGKDRARAQQRCTPSAEHAVDHGWEHGPPTHTPGLPWVLAGVVGAAWLALALWGASPYGHYLQHDGADGLAGVGLFVVGWTLMITAMMLPTAAGLLRAFQPIAQRHPQPGVLLGSVVTGFLGTWAVAGCVMRAADAGVHTALDHWAWLDNRSRLIAAAVLVLAGMYQWSALKHRCLRRCRSPRSFVYRFWRGGRPAADAVQVGLAYGRSCVGCCWLLMLLMFAVGSGNLGWMLGVGAVMAIEKNVAGGSRISVPIGGMLMAVGLVLGVTALNSRAGRPPPKWDRPPL